MSILQFIKPNKIRSTEKHNEMFSSDCGVNGTYVPNMSDQDMEKYKTKIINGERPRIETRITLGECSSCVLIKVNKTKIKREWKNNDPNWKKGLEHGWSDLKISMNGPLDITKEQWKEFCTAIDEMFNEVDKL